MSQSDYVIRHTQRTLKIRNIIFVYSKNCTIDSSSSMNCNDVCICSWNFSNIHSHFKLCLVSFQLRLLLLLLIYVCLHNKLCFARRCSFTCEMAKSKMHIYSRWNVECRSSCLSIVHGKTRIQTESRIFDRCLLSILIPNRIHYLWTWTRAFGWMEHENTMFQFNKCFSIRFCRRFRETGKYQIFCW